jgi:hypothetical protein
LKTKSTLRFSGINAGVCSGGDPERRFPFRPEGWGLASRNGSILIGLLNEKEGTMGIYKRGVSGPDFRIGMTQKYLGFRRFQTSAARSFLFRFCFFIFGFALLHFSGFCAGVASADPSALTFKEEVKRVIKKMVGPMTGPVLNGDNNAIQATLDKIILDAEKEGKPVRFGIGILDGRGLAVAGRYIVGTFKTDDFSKYNYVAKAFKQRKIVQDRLYFQGGSELLIICVPLVRQKEVVGAIVIGVDPPQIEKDYGLTTEQFMALDFNK